MDKGMSVTSNTTPASKLALVLLQFHVIILNRPFVTIPSNKYNRFIFTLITILV